MSKRLPDSAHQVLEFWYLRPEQPGHGQPRREWFLKNASFDAAIRRQFGGLIESALAGGHREWDAVPAGRLARILVLDQFTRNALRDTPRAFAGDALALDAACALADQGLDRELAPLQRWFAYMPFEHAEDLAAQERSVELFTRLCTEYPDLDGALHYARLHRDIIARFGRFPHRNAILGRPSTPEELAFLQQPGSGF